MIPDISAPPKELCVKCASVCVGDVGRVNPCYSFLLYCARVKAYLDYGSAREKGEVHSPFNWKM